MALTVPTEYDPISYDELTWVNFGQEPLLTIMRQMNFHYCKHTPQLINAAPIANAVNNPLYSMAFPRASDSLVYDIWTYVSTPGLVQVLINIFENTTNSVPPWTPTFGYGEGAAATGGRWIRASWTPALTTNFIRLEFNGLVPAGIQVQAIHIFPRPLTVAPAPPYPLASGAILFDDTSLLTPGAPIHTEYFERAAITKRAVMRDRKQCAFSYLDDDTNPLGRFTPGPSWPVQLVGMARPHIPGQKNAPLEVRARVLGVGAGSKLIISTQAGSSIDILADNTDRTGTIAGIPTDQPQIKVFANPTTSIDIIYLLAHWVPGD